jgi:protein-tyrosine phosphatase
MAQTPIGILFVCTGNICRSPTAEGVMRAMIEQAGWSDWVFLDSAGTHDYHVGEPPDPRTLRAACARGYDLSALRARQIRRDDFFRFHWILAMDRGHLAILERLRPPGAQATVALFLQKSRRQPNGEVPDPYYGGPEGFAAVLDLIEEGCSGWLTWLAEYRAQHLDAAPR